MYFELWNLENDFILCNKKIWSDPMDDLNFSKFYEDVCKNYGVKEEKIYLINQEFLPVFARFYCCHTETFLKESFFLNYQN